MADTDFLDASDGAGDAALMRLTAKRLVGATVFSVNTVAHVPAKFFATCGPLLASGLIDPTQKMEFRGHVSTGTLVIDALAPGATDIESQIGWAVIVRPNTEWANAVANFIQGLVQRGPVSTTSSVTPTPNADTTSIYALTALAANATFAAPTGTPVDGQPLLIRIKDNGTSRTLTWNAVYRALDALLPANTVISKTLYVGFVYNIADAKWDLVATVQQA